MVNEILDDAEGIKKTILEAGTISEQELNEKIKAKKEEFGNLLTEAGAAYSVSKELGIEIKKEIATFNDLKVKDLADGLNSITLTVRVKTARAPRFFEKGDKKGNVTNFQVYDETGNANFVLWNDAELAEKIQTNSTIKIINAYAKNNNGNIEIHSSAKGKVEFVENSAIPEQEEKIYKLNEITPNLDDVNFFARVERIYPIYEFNKKNGSTGKVASTIINDGESSKKLVLWDNHTALTEKLQPNDLIKVEGAYTRTNNNELEIHMGWKGRITTNAKANIPMIKRNRKTISQLTDEKEVEVKADVVEIYSPTIIQLCGKCKAMARDGTCPKCNSTESVYSLIVNAEIDDGTGVIRGTFYRDQAEKFLGLKANDFKADNSLFDSRKKQLLGEELIFFGQVKDVPDYNRKELIIRNFSIVRTE